MTALTAAGGAAEGDVELGLLLDATLGASVLTALTLSFTIAALAGVSSSRVTNGLPYGGSFRSRLTSRSARSSSCFSERRRLGRQRH